MIRRALLAALAALLLVAAAAPARAQSGGFAIERINDDDYPFVDVTVTVPEGLREFSLSTDAFTISEDGRPRQPSLGADAARLAPPHVVLAIDVSGSMQNAIGDARAAADAFVASLPEGSQVAVVTFGDDVEVALDTTDDLGAVRAAIADIAVADARAETALYDGVTRAADLLPARGNGPMSIIVLSDGEDTVSDAGQGDAVATVADSDATLWAVQLEGSQPNPAALQALASDDGQVVTAANAGQLQGIYDDLASEVSRRYLLRYESRADGPTEITVAVAWGTVSASQTREVDIAGRPAASREPPPVARPDVFTASVPLLGTRTAYALGLAAFVVGSLLLWLLFLIPRQRSTRERILGEQQQAERSWSRLSGIAEWTTELAERRVRDARLGRGLDRMLEGAGLDLRPGEVVVIVVSSMTVAYALGHVVAGPLLGILLLPLPAIAARLLLGMRRDRRQAAFSEQLTDVLQLITGSLRAGYGLLQGIDAVARDAQEPAAGEFRRILVEHRLGRDLSDAMNDCARRMANDDFSWVVQAITIHDDVGGDLARVLDNVTSTIRDRADVHRQVRTLSAEGRLSAIILTALPFLVLVAIQVFNDDYASVLFTEPVGWLMLAVAGSLMLVGVVWIRRLVRLRY